MIVEAIESVLAQNYPSFEHIVIDAGSTDGTLGLLTKYPHLKLINEPDNGMYDALNKGIRIATGEILGFLNTDDFYEPYIFAKLADIFTKRNVEAVIGTANFFLEDSEGTREYFFQSTPPLTHNYWKTLIIGSPIFNAWFFKKSVFDLIGMFDASYIIAGDRDLLLRFALFGLSYSRLDEVIYHYRYHPGSLSMNQDWLHSSKFIDENLRLINRYQDDPRMPDLASPLFRQFRTRETITGASRSIRSGNWKQAKTYSMQGFYYDHFWLAKFVIRAFTGIVRAILRRFTALPPQV
jgi:glycosyltransferase involved in cell wall biosynthesis